MANMPQIPKTPRKSHFIATLLLFCWFRVRFAFTVISNDCPGTVWKDSILWVCVQTLGGETNPTATFSTVGSSPCISQVARVFPLEISPHWVSEEPRGLELRSRKKTWRESLKMKTAVGYYNFKIMWRTVEWRSQENKALGVLSSVPSAFCDVHWNTSPPPGLQDPTGAELRGGPSLSLKTFHPCRSCSWGR